MGVLCGRWDGDVRGGGGDDSFAAAKARSVLGGWLRLGGWPHSQLGAGHWLMRS